MGEMPAPTDAHAHAQNPDKPDVFSPRNYVRAESKLPPKVNPTTKHHRHLEISHFFPGRPFPISLLILLDLHSLHY